MPRDAPFIGIEFGGTKTIVAVGTGPDDLADVRRIPTTTPEQTLAAVGDYVELKARSGVSGVGVGSFGPIGLDRDAPTFGHVLTTPKPGWSGIDVLGALRRRLPDPAVPLAWDTDVNVAAVGEARWGAGAGGLGSDLLYLTVGTGVGGGALSRGLPLHGRGHPEMGHIAVASDASGFPGVCPFHGACLEGIASGPALAARWGQPAEDLPDAHPAWATEADVLAAALETFTLVLSPSLIVLGGGVGARPNVIDDVRLRLRRHLARYLTQPNPEAPTPDVCAPRLGAQAGVLGAIALVSATAA